MNATLLVELIGIYPNFEQKIRQLINEIIAYERNIDAIKQLIIDEKLTPTHINKLVKVVINPNIQLYLKNDQNSMLWFST